MSIADNIRRIRIKSGLTQEEFGRIANVSAMAVSQWENGRAVPRMGAVQLIADYFGVSNGDIINEGAEPQPSLQMSDLTTREQHLVGNYRDMTPDGQDALMATSEALRERFGREG